MFFFVFFFPLNVNNNNKSNQRVMRYKRTEYVDVNTPVVYDDDSHARTTSHIAAVATTAAMTTVRRTRGSAFERLQPVVDAPPLL